MICGEIASTKEAFVDLVVIGPVGRTATVRALLDTGFTGWVALSPGLVEELELPFDIARDYELGNGEIVRMDQHLSHVEWHGERVGVDVLVSKSGAIIGMSLLTGSKVILDVIDGGAVTIEPR